jgi:protein required for attachment to host cells
MDDTGVTWVLAADGGEARVFAERVRSGPLKELTELRMQADERRRHGASHGRAGDDRHDHDAERTFLRRVAMRVALGASQGAYARLAVMAPPRALGFLKQALPAEVSRRIDVTDPHARTHEDAEGLRGRLREARARTWS